MEKEDQCCAESHMGTCHPEKAIGEARRILFKTAEEAEKAGFKLAKDCR